MHFHLPKPLHGWREFVGEVAIIVLGVLIALTLEAVVDDRLAGLWAESVLLGHLVDVLLESWSDARGVFQAGRSSIEARGSHWHPKATTKDRCADWLPGIAASFRW